MSNKANRKPPEHLSVESKGIWNDAISQYELSSADLALLRVALENRDLGNIARQDLRKRGNLITTEQGFKNNPSLLAAKGHDQLFLSAMRQLGLDLQEGPEERDAAKE